MKSAAARSNGSRSAEGWLAAGTAASRAAARMRTPRLESERSGDTSGQICEGETLANISRAPMRTIGSGSTNALRARLMFASETYGASSLNAPARAKAGVFASAATTASKAATSAWSFHAAWKASAYFCQPLRFAPCHVSIADAVHCADLSAWQSLQAFGVPSLADRSGRGTRKP